MTYRYSIGAIEDIGAAPYKIEGNPVIALVAQLNRFAGRTVNVGPRCTRRYVTEAFPLVPVISEQAAFIANQIMFDHYTCVDPSMVPTAKVNQIMAARGGYWSWVMNNLNEITTTIAQVADGAGIQPAKVGITVVDPKMTPKLPVGMLLISAAAVGAIYFFTRGKR